MVDLVASINLFTAVTIWKYRTHNLLVGRLSAPNSFLLLYNLDNADWDAASCMSLNITNSLKAFVDLSVTDCSVSVKSSVEIISLASYSVKRVRTALEKSMSAWDMFDGIFSVYRIISWSPLPSVGFDIEPIYDTKPLNIGITLCKRSYLVVRITFLSF